MHTTLLIHMCLMPLLERGIVMVHNYLKSVGLLHTADMLVSEMGWVDIPKYETGAIASLSDILPGQPADNLSSSSEQQHEQSNNEIYESKEMIASTIVEGRVYLCLAVGSLKNNHEVSVIFAGSVDKHIYCHDMTGQILSSFKVHDGPVLSLAVHPMEPNILLTSSMDKSHCIVDISCDDGNGIQPVVIHRMMDHSKYVVQVGWSSCGRFFGSASYDHSFNLYSFDRADAAAVKLIKSYKFHANVESFVFDANGYVIVAVREDNYLHFIDLNNSHHCEKRNMNANGDNWVSFSAMHVSLSPRNNGDLMVSTDTNKLLLFSTNSGYNGNNVNNGGILKLVHTFYDIPNDPLTSQPKHVWHPNGSFVYCTSDDSNYSILAIKVDSSFSDSRAALKGHSAAVRNLAYDSKNDTLISCSFDKTLCLWSKINQ